MTNFVFYTNPTVTLVCLPAGTPARYSLATVAHLTGVHPDLLRYYCRLGLFGAGAAACADDQLATADVGDVLHVRLIVLDL